MFSFLFGFSYIFGLISFGNDRSSFFQSQFAFQICQFSAGFDGSGINFDNITLLGSFQITKGHRESNSIQQLLKWFFFCIERDYFYAKMMRMMILVAQLQT